MDFICRREPRRKKQTRAPSPLEHGAANAARGPGLVTCSLCSPARAHALAGGQRPQHAACCWPLAAGCVLRDAGPGAR